MIFINNYTQRSVSLSLGKTALNLVGALATANNLTEQKRRFPNKPIKTDLSDTLVSQYLALKAVLDDPSIHVPKFVFVCNEKWADVRALLPKKGNPRKSTPTSMPT